jgi:hypothetical protein
MKPHVPCPGDLIVVDQSLWPPLRSGGMLRVVEPAAWFEPGEHLAVAPRDRVTTCWSPNGGASGSGSKTRFDTRGGPVRVLRLSQLPKLTETGHTRDRFWHWREDSPDRQRVEYTRPVTRWKIEVLPDEDVAQADDESSQATADGPVRSVHPIVRQIIDRDCHVSLSSRQVIRHVISRLRQGFDTFRRLTRWERRWLLEDCVRQHRLNRELYEEVMQGFFRKPDKRRPSTDRPCVLSGHEVVRMMRQHGMTIQKLAFRLGKTQKRVRQVRSEGLQDPLAVRDWWEAITGEDPGPLPERFDLTHVAHEEPCRWCGYPLGVGEHGFLYIHELFCSQHCARRSRGW